MARNTRSLTPSTPVGLYTASMRAFAFSSMVLLASLAWLPKALADAPPASASFSWVRADGADTCPDALAMARAVGEHLGRSPFAPDATQFIEAIVERRGLEWSVRIFVRDAAGTPTSSRTLSSDADTCAAISNAAAIAIAVAIDPDFAIRPSSAPPAESSPSPAPTPSAAPMPIVAITPTRRPRRAPRPPNFNAAVTLRAVGAIGMLPGLSAGIGLSADLFTVGRFGLSIGAMFFPEVQENEDGSRFGYLLATVTATPCVIAIRTDRLTLAGCAGIALGDLHASVYGAVPAQPGDRLWLAAMAGARFRFGIIGPLMGEIGVDGIVPVTSYRFFDAGDNVTLFQQTAVVGVAYSGLGVRFP